MKDILIKNKIKFIILVLFIQTFCYGDVMILKSGRSYTGTISRASSGKIVLKSDRGEFPFDEDQVDFPKCRFSQLPDEQKLADLLKEKNYAEAIPILKKMEEQLRDLPVVKYERILYTLGISLAFMDKASDATQYFNTLLKIFPNTQYKLEAEYWLIQTGALNLKSDEIIEKYNKIIENKNSNSRIKALSYLALAAHYNSLSEFKKALEFYLTVVVVLGDVEEVQESALHNSAELYKKLEQPEKAVFYYQQIVDTYPKSIYFENAKSNLLLISNEKGL